MIPFGPYRPDQPDLENPGVVAALGVVPDIGFYGPMRKLNVFTGALTDRCRGAVSGLDTSGNVLTFAGDETNLYRLSDVTWSDVSGATYATGANERWNFTQHGDTMIAANFSNNTQKWVLGTDSAFSDLSASAPKARYAAIWGSFLVLGYVNDAADGTVGFRIWWGPINAPTGDWTDTALQADKQDLYEAGEITGLVSGDPGIIFGKSAIYVSQYVGPDPVFQIDNTQPERGCPLPGSIATDGKRTFYWSGEGFYLTNGFESQPIGAGKFDDTFKASWSGDGTQVSSAVDPRRKLYIIAYPTFGATPNRKALYNWETGEWSEIPDEIVQCLARLLSPGYTLEQLDNIQSNLDLFPSSLDSPEWRGGSLFFGAFDGDNKFGTFGGNNHKAILETAERQLGAQSVDPEKAQIPGSTGFKSFVSGVRPLVDTQDVQVRLGKRDLQSGAIVYTAAKSPETRTGICKFNAGDEPDARYMRAEVTISENAVWSEAQGIDIDAEVSGSE